MPSYTFDFDAWINTTKYEAGKAYTVPDAQLAMLMYSKAIRDPNAPTVRRKDAPFLPEGTLTGTSFACKGTTVYREAWINDKHYVPGQTYTLTQAEIDQLRQCGMIQ